MCSENNGRNLAFLKLLYELLHQMLASKSKHVVYNVLMQPYNIIVIDGVVYFQPNKWAYLVPNIEVYVLILNLISDSPELDVLVLLRKVWNNEGICEVQRSGWEK
jgi:hypothetical protein